jgi:cytochrome c oxidase subunit II
MASSQQEILRTELRWGAVMGVLVAGILGLIIYAALALHISPPSNVELIDPKTLQLSGEFTEQNLGTQVSGDGSVTARIVATQYAFLPQCVAVPLNRPVTLRLASPDVIHGFLIAGTNVNTMVVPGYVSQVHATFTQPGETLMPCHEFCGLGHSAMLGRVQVLPADQFKPDAQGRVACAQH